MSTHAASISWALKEGEDFLAGHYSRGHAISFDGGVSLPGSASPAVVKAPWSVEAAADPEEMLVASLSACHMLWFLDFARRAGVTVTTYQDAATARMGKMDSGKIGITDCILHPHIEATGPDGAPASADLLADLHHKAHDACNIANSVLTRVSVEPAQGA